MASGIALPELLGIIMDLSPQSTCEIREPLLTNCSRQQRSDWHEATLMAGESFRALTLTTASSLPMRD